MAQFDSEQRTFVRGEGNYLFDSQDRRVFDAVSSIWTTIHGHCRPEIVEAIARQAATLDHATLLGASNPVAEELAARLTAMTGLDRVFFSSDGASAVEAALKMALQYWQNEGQGTRTRFVRLIASYHGDTVGAMSVSDIAVFKERFGVLTFESLPYEQARDVLDRPDVAAVIVEPIVQAAAGIRIVPSAAYVPLKQMAPLLIVDEIATGFGRTGTMFAFQQLDLRPDIVCLGKGITGGALALSATVASDRVYASFLGENAQKKQFFHGHSYAGNPIACAAALASLDIFEKDGTLAHVAKVARKLSAQLLALRAHPEVREVRQAGLMCAIELHGPSTYEFAQTREFNAQDDKGDVISGRHGSIRMTRVANQLYERGFFTRPIGNAIQLVPPLTSTPEELSAFVSALVNVLESEAMQAKT
ncbi:MAG: aminotransferase class III-fold pyridoxal phosphate-dependent enzyme [Candidatus Eremiobacteraeota bacterium]|nr:aminotransferase class III-fold pyridoxal phosphate-dependent enzyme [Candidatus Eremiobacteraeota bacterium]